MHLAVLQCSCPVQRLLNLTCCTHSLRVWYVCCSQTCTKPSMVMVCHLHGDGAGTAGVDMQAMFNPTGLCVQEHTHNWACTATQGLCLP